MQLLSDREALMTAVSGSHDSHLGRLIGAEDKLRQREVQRQRGVLESFRRDEAERNRRRMEEVDLILQRNEEQLAKVEAELDREEDDM